MAILHDIGLAIWFMLPAAAANAMPILVAKLPVIKHWDAPLDLGTTFRGQPLLGSHKTWRGLASGILTSTLVLWLQQLLYAHFAPAHWLGHTIIYTALPTLALGPLFGLGALGGDAIKSFFKRRRGTASGASWIPFDQIDYIIGAVLVSLPFVTLSLRQYIFVFAIWFGVHVGSTYLGWKLGLKEQPI